jgi:RimJ/RimL family protein N-acetyltransferase
VDKADLIVQPLEERHALQILEWRYKPPYDVYDLGKGDADEIVESLLLPDYAYHAILGPDDELVAFCCFGEDAQVPGGNYDSQALDLGLGVRPDLTGQGQSHVYIQAVLDYARRHYAARSYRVTIAEFNTRAQRAWTKAGFRPLQRFESTHSHQPFAIYGCGIQIQLQA